MSSISRSLSIHLVCGYFETGLQSFRENQFALRLAERGHRVTVWTSTESYIWARNRAGLPQTNPRAQEEQYAQVRNLRIVRRKPFFRMGDLVLFPISARDFAGADIVHVLDFRQGVTAIAAQIAKRRGIPVVYDHEQRGDRAGSILHSLDNKLRRMLIRYGSQSIDLVRHTVNSNRAFFQSVARSYNGPFSLAPLGVNEHMFYPSQPLRFDQRQALGLGNNTYMVLLTGKIDLDKRPHEVAKAVAESGGALFVAGKVSDAALARIEGVGGARILGEVTQPELNRLYNACDAAIFTTFTLSYWEALAAGAPIIVPSTKFSQDYLAHREGVHLFGAPEMFAVEEERYRDDFSLAQPLANALLQARETGGRPADVGWLSWEDRISTLESQYSSLCS